MSSSNEFAIRVAGISKCHTVFERPSDRLKQMASSAGGRIFGREARRYFTPFWSLRDVSLDVSRGECVGILGRNGAGKSTLLQIITGTLTPTTGRVEIEGRVAALLELGSGFNPDFTGMENVYLNASLLGMTRREVDERLDAILAFADIGEFVHRPVKTYSSGMVVRLAFAVQAQIDPDVLIVDEALAVGDAKFQAKCFARLKTLRDRGTSILLVTHSTEQVVIHCDRAILLEGGRKVADGEPRAVANQYLDLLYGRQPSGRGGVPERRAEGAPVLPDLLERFDPDFATRPEVRFESRPLYNRYEHRWGDRGAELVDFAVFAEDEPFPHSIRPGAMLTCYVRYRFFDDIQHPIFGVTLKTKEGVTVYGTNTEMTPPIKPFDTTSSVDGVIACRLTLNCAPGDYFLSFGIASRDGGGEALPHDRRYDAVYLPVGTGEPFLGITDLRAGIAIL